MQGCGLSWSLEHGLIHFKIRGLTSNSAIASVSHWLGDGGRRLLNRVENGVSACPRRVRHQDGISHAQWVLQGMPVWAEKGSPDLCVKKGKKGRKSGRHDNKTKCIWKQKQAIHLDTKCIHFLQCCSKLH